MTNGVPQIVGVGHNCLDHICMVEAYPPEDGSTHITSIQIDGGGAVATALAAAARLGVPSQMIGDLGDDTAGHEILRLLERDGVDTGCIRLLRGERSSVSYVMVDPACGSRTKFPYPDALPPLAWDEPRRCAVQSARVLHLDGTKYDNALSAAQLARSAGVTVSLDGCHMEADNEKNRALAAAADILIMNAKYPTRITGREDYGAALLEISKWGPKIVIGTRGAEGCFAVLDGVVRHFPAYPVRAMDTTGAGDVFHGAFLASWVDGTDTETCIRFASAAAALKCMKPGGRAGIPNRGEVLSFLRDAAQ